MQVPSFACFAVNIGLLLFATNTSDAQGQVTNEAVKKKTLDENLRARSKRCPRHAEMLANHCV